MFRALCIPVAMMCAVLFTACSAHPLPEDVTRRTTFDIVQKLRCEARDGLESAVRAGWLDQTRLLNTFIGYDFTFDITESNNANGGLLEFLSPFQSGKLALEIKAGADRKRQNTRFFRAIELMADLRVDPDLVRIDGPCSMPERSNFIYPIAGRVGIDEVVTTYSKLRMAVKFRAKEMLVFSDTLEFTTTFTAAVKPTLELNSVAGQFRLTKASINGDSQRIDKHKVAIAIAAKESITDIPKTFAIVPPYRSSSVVIAPREALGVVIELDRLRSLSEDARVFDPLRR